MYKTKFIFTSAIFVIFLIITSSVKNKTRIIEKKISNLSLVTLYKKKDVYETQLEFYYLTSPYELERRLNLIDSNNYRPIEYSKIFFGIADYNKLNNKVSNLKKLNEKK